MKRLLYVIGTVLFMSCQSSVDNHNIESKNSSNKDPNESSFEEEPTYKQMVDEYVLMYDKKVKIDTTFSLNDKIYRLHFEHYCLFDTLIVPDRYSWSDNPQDFNTHNFESIIQLINAEDTLVNTTIDKGIFDKILDENLLKYGVLLYPNYRGVDTSKSIISMQYSVSVPVTDVGRSVELEIDLNGDLKIK